MKHVKVQEVRPDPCGTRLGDVVLLGDGTLALQVKCRRCTKANGTDTFHYVVMNVIDSQIS